MARRVQAPGDGSQVLAEEEDPVRQEPALHPRGEEKKEDQQQHRQDHQAPEDVQGRETLALGGCQNHSY
jgi:hypothetical protein